jgi:hypothetical protein
MSVQVYAPEGECRAYEKLSTGLTSSLGFTAAKLLYKGRIAQAVLISVEIYYGRNGGCYHSYIGWYGSLG